MVDANKARTNKIFYFRKRANGLRGFEEKLLEYQEKFKNLKIQNTLIGKLISDVVGFYNREQKSRGDIILIEDLSMKN